jgi:L-fuconolactonase
MFGSDWPVCLLAASYAEVHRVVADYTAALGERERASIFGESAREFYDL